MNHLSQKLFPFLRTLAAAGDDDRPPFAQAASGPLRRPPHAPRPVPAPFAARGPVAPAGPANPDHEGVSA